MKLFSQAAIACLFSAQFAWSHNVDAPALSWRASRTLDAVAISARQSANRANRAESTMSSGRRRWHIDITLPQVGIFEAPGEAPSEAVAAPSEGAPAEAAAFSAPREGAPQAPPPAMAGTAAGQLLPGGAGGTPPPCMAWGCTTLPPIPAGPSKEAVAAHAAAAKSSVVAGAAVAAAAAAAKTPSMESKIASTAASAASAAAVTATQTAEAAMAIAKAANAKLDELHGILKAAAQAHSQEMSDVRVNPPLIPRQIPMGPSPAASPAPAMMR